MVLRYYEQLEYDEIAALTGVREGSVRSRVSRGIAALRAELGEESAMSDFETRLTDVLNGGAEQAPDADGLAQAPAAARAPDGGPAWPSARGGRRRTRRTRRRTGLGGDDTPDRSATTPR